MKRIPVLLLSAVFAFTSIAPIYLASITPAYADTKAKNAGGGPGNSGPGDKNSPGKGKGGVGPGPGPGGKEGAAPDKKGK